MKYIQDDDDFEEEDYKQVSNIEKRFNLNEGNFDEAFDYYLIKKVYDVNQHVDMFPEL